MQTAIHQTSATGQAIPPCRSRCQASSPGDDKNPGHPAGSLVCHCGLIIPVASRVVGFFHIVDGYAGAMQNCVCHATKSRALWTVTARGFVRRPWGGA